MRPRRRHAPDFVCVARATVARDHIAGAKLRTGRRGVQIPLQQNLRGSHFPRPLVGNLECCLTTALLQQCYNTVGTPT